MTTVSIYGFTRVIFKHPRTVLQERVLKNRSCCCWAACLNSHSDRHCLSRALPLYVTKRTLPLSLSLSPSIALSLLLAIILQTSVLCRRRQPLRMSHVTSAHADGAYAKQKQVVTTATPTKPLFLRHIAVGWHEHEHFQEDLKQ